MKFQKILIIILLVLFPFGEILRFDIGNHIVIKPIDLITGVIAVIFVVGVFSKAKVNIRQSWYFLAFPAIALVSLAVNSHWLKPQELAVSAFYLVRWVSYFSVLFVIKEFDNDFKRLINKIMVFDGAIIVFAGYIQYFFFNSLKPLWYLGWDDHLNRVFTVFFDPNYAGSFFVLYSVFLTGILIKRLKNSKKGSIYTDKLTLLIIALIAATVLAISLTFSRSALIMFGVSFSLFFILIKMKKLVFGALGLIIIYIIAVSPKFYDENMNLFRVASSMARVSNYEKAIIIIKDHPLIGVGFNTYRYTKELYGFDYGWVKAPSHSDAGVENSFLFVTATTGAVGLAAFLLMWYRLAITQNSSKKRSIDYDTAVIRAGIAGLFVNALFINSLFYAPIMLWVWFVIGRKKAD